MGTSVSERIMKWNLTPEGLKPILGCLPCCADEPESEDASETAVVGGVDSSSWVQNHHDYQPGDRVFHKGKEWVCLQGHTTNGDGNWAPPTAHSLWERA